ncbi:MAG: DUF2497 domain-containing protein [Rhizobiales bacterium]|nr:DUF2497 domain-containing protein [Hyphomicrobiales bacterium]
MNQPAKAQEPSMEEILASIRRIISNDDNGGKPAAAPPPQPAPPPGPKVAFPAPQRPVPTPVPPAATAPRVPPASPLAAAPIPKPAEKETLSDFDAIFPDTRSTAASPVAEPASADILDLTEAMASPESAAAAPDFRTIDGQSDIVFTDPEPEAPPPPSPDRAASDPIEDARQHFSQFPSDRSLLSPSTSAAVDSAFNALAQTVLVQNGRTLEDLVREMLRPMLKSWLDDNLPGLVERLVRAEIERVSRGR